MIDKLIIDGANIELTEKDKFPYTYNFSTAKTHTVKYALSDTDEISANAFTNCTYMTKVKFPPEISRIKRRAFENCSRLNNVTIPSTIHYIGANVWDGCTSLTNMKFEHQDPNDPDTGITNYAEIPSNCTVIIPNGSKYSYVEGFKNLTPDTVDYYTKTKYNMFSYVPARNMEDNGTEYYKDNWTSIAPNDQTVEEENEIPIDDITFENSSIIMGRNVKQMVKVIITPENATNKRLHVFTSVNGLNERNPDIAVAAVANAEDLASGKDKSEELIIQTANRIGSIDFYVYAENGIYSILNVETSTSVE